MKKNMDLEFVVIAPSFLSGVCLTIIAVRHRTALLGGLFSSEMRVDLDRTDKQLGLAALVFFVLFIVALFATARV
jgi:hypothetical protein